MLTNLDQVQTKARAINNQPLDTETVGQGVALVRPVTERITKPTITDEGQKAPARRFGDLRVHALAGALANVLLAVTGITNKHLRVLMTGLLHRPYSISQASYDLTRLARNGLIQPIPNRNQYTPTRDRHLFTQIYTKVHNRVLYPLMAPNRPNAPPELLEALDTIDRIVTQPITDARLPTTT